MLPPHPTKGAPEAGEVEGGDDDSGPSVVLTPSVLATRCSAASRGFAGSSDIPSAEPASASGSGSIPLMDAVAADCSRMRIATIHDISPAISLRKLVLARNRLARPESLVGLAHCKHITYLDLSGNKLESFQGLEPLVALKVLNMSHNRLNRISIHVQKLTALNALILNNNEIVRLDNISGLKALNTLVVSHNKLEDISGVSALTNLTKLSASNNSIRRFPELAGLVSLRELRVAHNKLTVLPPTVLTHLPALEILDLGHNLLPAGTPAAVASLTTALGAAGLRLTNLNLKGNPAADDPACRDAVRAALPSLRVLDGQRFDPKFLARKERKAGRSAPTATRAPSARIDSVAHTEPTVAGLERKKRKASGAAHKLDARPPGAVLQQTKRPRAEAPEDTVAVTGPEQKPHRGNTDKQGGHVSAGSRGAASAEEASAAVLPALAASAAPAIGSAREPPPSADQQLPRGGSPAAPSSIVAAGAPAASSSAAAAAVPAEQSGVVAVINKRPIGGGSGGGRRGGRRAKGGPALVPFDPAALEKGPAAPATNVSANGAAVAALRMVGAWDD
ncbi:hypothetical protein HK405_007886 [Cladochytrium tenue]|nr:hypothetical protein HK405_007886 [Cladochytrium tenue]